MSKAPPERIWIQGYTAREIGHGYFFSNKNDGFDVEYIRADRASSPAAEAKCDVCDGPIDTEYAACSKCIVELKAAMADTKVVRELGASTTTAIAAREAAKMSDAEFYARGIARSRYHDKLFAEGRPRPTNEQFDEGWAAGRAYSEHCSPVSGDVISRQEAIRVVQMFKPIPLECDSDADRKSVV